MLREMGVQPWPRERTAGDAAVAAERREARAPAPASVEVPAARAPAPNREPIAVAGTAKLAPADWLFVGDPFEGVQQEQLLDNMLRAIGVAVVAPDRERRAAFCAVAPGPASAATRASDRSALQAAIATVAPRCILAFGGAAAQTLLGDDAPLGGLRGRVRAHADVPVVVTFALAYLLRHPAEKAKAWADLCLAVGSLAASAA
jgi:DNA polymerase